MSRYVDLEAALRIVKAEWMRVRDDTVPGDIALQMVEQEIRALPTVDVDALREEVARLRVLSDAAECCGGRPCADHLSREQWCKVCVARQAWALWLFSEALRPGGVS